MSLFKDKAYINGEWVSALSKKTFEVKNPGNGEIVGVVPDMDGADADLAIKAAHDAFKTWSKTTAKQRQILLRKWLQLLRENQDEINKILAAETAKVETESELVMGHNFLEYFAEEATRIQGEILPDIIPNKKMYVEKQPIGVVALITPWNVPYGMLLRKISPALAAGCTCVIKPAEDTPLDALAAVQLSHEAGIPKGVINVVTCDRGNAPSIGKALCSSRSVAGISFTGSSQVGKILYRQCAPQIKRITLELGGNSPLIVFKSADIDLSVDVAVRTKFRICGQACISPNRFFVHEDIFEEYVEKFVEATKTQKLGPLINVNQFKRLSAIVQDAVDNGGKILTGGKPDASKGELYYQPTVIVNVNKDMRVYYEEIFGPVACFYKFKTEEEVIELANDTEKGLAAYVYTQDYAQIHRVTKELESGMVFVNEGMVAPTEAPFGGVKESGIGREGSHHNIEEFTYMKYVCLGGL